jgi:hypothetical protein
MEAAKRDLRTIVSVEVGFIKMRKKFASLNELVSNGDRGQVMLRTIWLRLQYLSERKSVSARAYPLATERLPKVHVHFFGPGLDPVLADLQENN